MQKKKPQKSFSPVLIFLPVIILIMGVVIFTTLLRKDAEVVLLIAPSTANIKLDGKKVHNGSVKISAGSHSLGISGEGLENKNIDFEVSKNETIAINAYLLSEANDFEYYQKNDSEIALLELVADDDARIFVESYRKSKMILEILPLSIAKNHGEKSSTLSAGQNCERNFCLKIKDDNSDMRKDMEKKIEELGFNPADYEIQYERTNSLEEDDIDE